MVIEGYRAGFQTTLIWGITVPEFYHSSFPLGPMVIFDVPEIPFKRKHH